MKETKFRAKALTGELVYFNLHDSHLSGDPDLVFYVGGIPCEAGSEQQYTGLKDKNGKEGYHKDIVDFKHTRSTGYWIVEWNDSEAKYVLRSEMYGEIPLRKIKEAVIIGNIYENKEPLNE